MPRAVPAANRLELRTDGIYVREAGAPSILPLGTAAIPL